MPKPTQDKIRITFLVLAFSLIMFVSAFLLDSPRDILKGELEIIKSPSILITDYTALAGLGAALFNVGLVTLICLGLAYLINARFNGYFIAAVFTIAGFSFFGKNPFNILPIFLGVYLYDRFFSHAPLRDLIAPLLFGTTLGPVISQVAFGFGSGWQWLVLGISLGILSGILLAGLMKHIYSLHLGYNLYNTGTTGGFVATVIFMFLRGFDLDISPAFFWSTEYTGVLTLISGAVLLLTVIAGFFFGGSLEGYRKILHNSGRLTADFVDMSDLGTTLINMGVVGLMGLGYIHLVGGDVNGATLAGVFTVFGFGALGKHPRNILPVMVGVYLVCIPNVWTHAEPGPLLAALFCTTLAPLAGRFGFFAGMAAGALHLPMVMHVGGLHGYMNLYNNGFAGGLAMLIIVGFIKYLRLDLLEEDWV